MENYEVCWQEFDRNGRIVTKRKAFKSERAFNRFVDKLFAKENFFKVLAYR